MTRPISTLRKFLFLLLFAIPAVHADALDDVIERGTLRVGVAVFVPWTIRTESDELIGFEIDIGRKIAADMGVDVAFEVYAWDDIIPGLENGEIDVIAGGMAITPARALRVNFTRPIAQSGVAIATNTELTQDIANLDQLNQEDITITTVGDTLAASVAERLFADANVVSYGTPVEAEAEILEGRAHAYVASMPETRFLVLKNPLKLDLPMNEPLLASREGLAVRKGEQELLNFLNAWVTARQADKWLPTTHDYWFGTLEWTPAAKQ